MRLLSSSSRETWQRVGDTPPSDLVDARLQLHWAAQIAASVGYTYLDPVPDWSHVSLNWLDDGCLLATGAAPGGFRAALRLADLTLLLLDKDAVTMEAFALDGKTLDAGYAWLADAIKRFTGADRAKPLTRPNHELPAHGVSGGGPFKRSPSCAFADLARWFGNAALYLDSIAKKTPGASAVRCWPHHFDIATLITLDAGVDAEEARSVGVGLSPGDGGYTEPYWYVTPWPYPKDPVLTALGDFGHWHTEGWTGAVLTGSEIVGDGNAFEQAGRTANFFDAAITASLKLVGSV